MHATCPLLRQSGGDTLAMWQKKVKQLLVGLRVKSSPLGSRQGWQQPQQTLVLSRALCQVVPGQQTRVRQKAEAALCQQSVAEQAVLHSPRLPDPLCPWDRLHSPFCLRGRLGGDLPGAPPLLALLPTGTESCRGNGRTSPTHKATAKIQLAKFCCKKKTQQVLVVHSIAGHAGRCVFIKNQCSNQVSGEQTKPCQVSGSAPPLLTLNSVPGFPLLLSSYQAGKSTLTISTFSL